MTTQLNMLDRAVAKLLRAGMTAEMTNVIDGTPDWAFVILCHSLIEGAVNDSLSRHISPPEAAQEIVSLSIARRLALMNKLSLARPSENGDELTRQALSFARALGKLRNQYAHKVSLVVRSIDEVIDAHPDTQLRSELESGFHGEKDEPTRRKILAQLLLFAAYLHVEDELRAAVNHRQFVAQSEQWQAEVAKKYQLEVIRLLDETVAKSDGGR